MTISTSQITRALQRSILDGTLAPGKRLPFHRLLAADLHCARNLVVLASEQLTLERYLIARPKTGTFVSPVDFAYGIGEPDSRLIRRLRASFSTALRRGIVGYVYRPTPISRKRSIASLGWKSSSSKSCRTSISPSRLPGFGNRLAHAMASSLDLT